MRLYDLFLDHPTLTTDSRQIPADSLFFALRGASFDGNRFTAEALQKGAAYAVVDDPGVVAEHPELRERMVLVEDTLTALQTLAREHRRRLGIPILAIVGSNGKTTTKELTHSVLSKRFRTYATRGNLNNHIGVPLTLLAMGRDTEFGVVEMGASACGEIALLASIAEPNYGIITNIGRSHLEGFGGPEGIRRGKGELFDFLHKQGGRAFVPEEDATLREMALERPNLAVEYYSTTIAEGVENQLEGDFNRLNIAAAMAIGRYFGVAEQALREAIAAYRPQNHRSQRISTPHNTLILDCYNANPSSMAASIEHFAKEKPDKEQRKVLILGDMLELGAWSEEEHQSILKQALAVADATILLVGQHFKQAWNALGGDPRAVCFESRSTLTEWLAEHPINRALILIKGSHSIGLEALEKIL